MLDAAKAWARANGAAGTFAGVAREMESMIKSGVERVMGGIDMVSREEFEAVKEMAANARAEADALKARIEKLEAAGRARKGSPAA